MKCIQKRDDTLGIKLALHDGAEAVEGFWRHTVRCFPRAAPGRTALLYWLAYFLQYCILYLPRPLALPACMLAKFSIWLNWGLFEAGWFVFSFVTKCFSVSGVYLRIFNYPMCFVFWIDVFSQWYAAIFFLNKWLMYEIVCSVQEQVCCKKEQVCCRIATKVQSSAFV